MAKLFLSGGGNEYQTKEIDKTFVQHIDKSKEMLYIPIAMAHGSKSYESCYNWITNTFENLGITQIMMWVDISDKTLKDLKEFSAIYIGGGNTYYLLHELQRTGFIHLLKQYLADGGRVYGGSAGAIVLGRDIATCDHMDSNDIGVTSTQGLNRIDDYSIWCHYRPEHDRLIQKYIEENHLMVLALSEETGIEVTEKGTRVIGNKPAFRFSRNNKEMIDVAHYIK